MTPLAPRMFSDLAAWQAMLDRERELFQDLQPGSRIGLVPRGRASIVAGRHCSAAAARFDADEGGHEMLVWEARCGRMRAGVITPRMLHDAALDLILVVDDDAAEAIGASLEGEPLAVMKRLIRLGHILFYVTRTKDQLRDAGYEDFLDSLGLAFLGACR